MSKERVSQTEACCPGVCPPEHHHQLSTPIVSRFSQKHVANVCEGCLKNYCPLVGTLILVANCSSQYAYFCRRLWRSLPSRLTNPVCGRF
ncbi:unnamed protein product [Haemonchus placei]|uniref:LITAF domain-containing protein n=1 Tax=Haemonchus placei TaxID=6290 RepID=A0A0N4WY50_HAEPC|nr:unnamed protein product [Haemonchus placei]